MTSATWTLADFGVGLRHEDIPLAVREHARACITDAVGCGLAGAQVPWVRTLADFAGGVGWAEVRLWGTHRRAQRLYAALVNGTAISALELEDTHGPSVQHLGPTVLPAVLAAAECHKKPVTGRELISAVVVGYETSIRVGLAISPSAAMRGFHPSGLCGPFGAAAGAAKILRLSAEQTLHAIGIAGSLGSGLQGIDSDALMKRMQPGNAAKNGLFAAMLAERGITGMTDVLDEIEYGVFCRAVADECHFESLVSGLGREFEILGIGFKIYPSCRSSHTAIDAVRGIMADHPKLDPADIRQVKIACSSVTYRLCRPKRWDTVNSAQLSIPYCVAVCLVDGDVGLAQFSEARLRDPNVARLAERVALIADPDIDRLGAAGRWSVRIQVVTADGTYEAVRDQPSGSSEYPLSGAALEEKFLALTAPAYSEDRMRRLLGALGGLEELPDIATLDVGAP